MFLRIRKYALHSTAIDELDANVVPGEFLLDASTANKNSPFQCGHGYTNSHMHTDVTFLGSSGEKHSRISPNC